MSVANRLDAVGATWGASGIQAVSPATVGLGRRRGRSAGVRALVRCIMGVAVDSDHGVRFVGCVCRAVVVGETSSRDGSLRNNRAES
jgi:hypothetical protein